jgi:hypothetical protein
VRALLVRLDGAVPASPGAEPCRDAARVGWTLAIAREVALVGATPGSGAFARVADISDVAPCFAGTDISVRP